MNAMNQLAASPELGDDSLPPELVEATKLTGDDFSNEYGRILIANLLPSIDIAIIDDQDLRSMLETLPSVAWQRGVEIADLEIFLISTYRLLNGGQFSSETASLNMGHEDYMRWYKTMLADISAVINVDDLVKQPELPGAERFTQTPKLHLVQ